MWSNTSLAPLLTEKCSQHPSSALPSWLRWSFPLLIWTLHHSKSEHQDESSHDHGHSSAQQDQWVGNSSTQLHFAGELWAKTRRGNKASIQDHSEKRLRDVIMTQTLYMACRLAPFFFHGFFLWVNSTNYSIANGPPSCRRFFPLFFAYVKKNGKKILQTISTEKRCWKGGSRKIKRTATGFGNSRSRNKGGDGFSPTNIGKKMAQNERFAKLRIIRWQKCFFGKQKKNKAKMLFSQLLQLLGTPFGWFIDSTGVPFWEATFLADPR